MLPRPALLATVTLVLACGGSGDGSSGSASGTEGTTGTGTETSGATTDGPREDLPPPDGECGLHAQDCMDPTVKCMPWSLEDDRIPDETKCCPVVENPKQIDEPCQAFDYDGSCLDDCDKGLLCVLDDQEGLAGFCHQLCDAASSGSCDADETCKPFFEMIEEAPEVPICMDQCDPLVQDCERTGWTCLPDSPTVAGQSGFICTPPPPGNPKGPGEPCALANDCEGGLTCVPADRLPDCMSLTQLCCTAFCDLANGDADCVDLPGTECVDWMSPDPKWQNVGVCAVPA